MTGLQFAIIAYTLSTFALFGYALRVWVGYRSLARGSAEIAEVRQGGDA